MSCIHNCNVRENSVRSSTIHALTWTDTTQLFNKSGAIVLQAGLHQSLQTISYPNTNISYVKVIYHMLKRPPFFVERLACSNWWGKGLASSPGFPAFFGGSAKESGKPGIRSHMTRRHGNERGRAAITVPRSLAKRTDSVARPWHPYLDATMTYLWACLAGGLSIPLRMLRGYTHKLRHSLLAVRQSYKVPTLWSDLGSWTLCLWSFTHTYL